MGKVNDDSIVDLIFNLTWKSDYASHTDCYQASNVNIWRDHFPPALLENIMNKNSGDRIELSFKQGDILPKIESQKIFRIKSGQFSTNFEPISFHKPCAGRFYPKGILQGIANVFKGGIEKVFYWK